MAANGQNYAKICVLQASLVSTPESCPRPTPCGSAWTNQEYNAHLRQYIEDVLQAEGWGIDMWHNIATDSDGLSTGGEADEIVFRTHLAALTSDYGQRIWIAPLGQVARDSLRRAREINPTRFCHS